MLDLKSMSDEDFSIVVTPASKTITHITIDESGKVSLSSKVAETFAKKPVQLRFNRDLTAIQLVHSAASPDPNSIVFPKNGRKIIWNATELLRQNRVPFPAVFQGYFCQESEQWRGERQPNPTARSSGSTRNTKKQ